MATAIAEGYRLACPSIRAKVLGPDHADVATGLNNLANLYSAQGRYAQAEPLYQRSLAIDEQALGPEHPGVAANFHVEFRKRGDDVMVVLLLVVVVVAIAVAVN